MGAPPARAAVVLGAFDPPTRAHVALARAGAAAVGGEGILGLTRVLLDRPGDVLLEPPARAALVCEVARGAGLGVLAVNRARYVDVADALTEVGVDATFVVGSDKIAQLSDPVFYQDGAAGIERTFDRVSFLVVERDGHPVGRKGLEVLSADAVFTEPGDAAVSSTQVRRRWRRGEPIDDLVPPEVGRGLAGYTAAT